MEKVISNNQSLKEILFSGSHHPIYISGYEKRTK